jgi:predicted nucleic-acid-binding Zn-ribbon protein
MASKHIQMKPFLGLHCTACDEFIIEAAVSETSRPLGPSFQVPSDKPIGDRTCPKCGETRAYTQQDLVTEKRPV